MRRTIANESMGLRVHIIPGLNIYAQRKDAASTSSYRPGSSGGGIGSSSGVGGVGGGSYHHGGYMGNSGKTGHTKSCEL